MQELAIETMFQMTYGGNFEQEHAHAVFHDLTDQEKFDIVLLSEHAGKATDNPLVTIVAHAFKMGKIAGIRQERAKKCKK
ncbi:hypothetical protein [Streptococcus suis]|uniref:hypothetical protein n=1 Tax=Streptococcus suis TaxID=1307 RepID=UPI002AADB38D|nr:hypothetical protein [Streptococcus suis]HEM4584293.1 hypothetical protein [Streptococcus suis]